MFVFYLSALLSLAAALRPTPQASQPAYPQQQQASDNLWDRIDVHELNKQLGAWDNEPISTTKRPPQIIEQARQIYPDIPRPILPYPVDPTVLPPLPQGCLAPRGQFPSPKSCAHYLNCWDDVVIEQQCPGALLFNELTSVCDFEYNVYCAGRPGLPPKPELPPGAKVCPDPNGRYRSSTNCSEFYVCVYGRPVKYSCPRGLVYNEDLGVCDYVYRVDCRGSAVPKPWIPHPPVIHPHPVLPAGPYGPQIQPTRAPQQPYYPTPEPQQPYYPPPVPEQPYYPPQVPQQPYYPTQHPPQPTYPVPIDPWIGGQTRVEPDPWHQRPVASAFEIQKEKDKVAKEEQEKLQQQLGQGGAGVGPLNLQQDTPEKPILSNPWGDLQAIPAQLTKIPCNDGSIHRLTDSCSRVVVCRKGRPQLVHCPVGEIYDRPSDSCKLFTIAKC